MQRSDKFYINIGRQFGAGGMEIGKRLSQMFGIPFYDKELIYLASTESGISREFFENVDEKPVQQIRGGFLGMLSSTFSDYYPSSTVLDKYALFKIQSDVIRRVAKETSAVFIGRCADYILREEPRCLNVFICANTKDRIARLRKSKRLNRCEDMSDREIMELLEKGDKRRSTYYNSYTHKVWGASGPYHLCLDSSWLGVDKCVEIIAQLVRERFTL